MFGELESGTRTSIRSVWAQQQKTTSSDPPVASAAKHRRKHPKLLDAKVPFYLLLF